MIGQDRKQWGTTPWTYERVPQRGGQVEAAQVAIIGGGFTGASTAYHLAKRGISAAIFEASRIGEGASGRTGGLVLEGTAAGPLEQADSCVPELDRLVKAEAIDCGLRLPGCWEIEHGAGHNQRLLPWQDAGQPIHIANTVSGGVVEPARLLIGLLRAAIGLGATLHENTPVRRIVTTPQPAIEFGRQVVYPEYIVVAANAWLSELLPLEHVNVHSSLTFACATQPLDAATLQAIGLAEGIPFYTTDLPYLWGRTMDDGRVVFGAGLVFGSPQELEASDVNRGSPRAALAQLEDRVRGLHPGLRKVEFSASWGGPIAFTEDAVPLLGRLPDRPTVIVAGAYAGHGVALSVHAGRLAARAIVEGAELPRWGALDRRPPRRRRRWRR
jgi:gamma-glutamylputrescine oxidase